MKCRNDLHEIDPDDPWRGPDRQRCRACLREKRRRGDKRKILIGQAAARAMKNRAAYNASRLESERRLRKNPAYLQMKRDCNRLGLSRAEWRRQVSQGIIQLQEG